MHSDWNELTCIIKTDTHGDYSDRDVTNETTVVLAKVDDEEPNFSDEGPDLIRQYHPQLFSDEGTIEVAIEDDITDMPDQPQWIYRIVSLAKAMAFPLDKKGADRDFDRYNAHTPGGNS